MERKITTLSRHWLRQRHPPSRRGRAPSDGGPIIADRRGRRSLRCLTEVLSSRPFALKARGKGDHRRWGKGPLPSPGKDKERKNSHTLPALALPTPPSLSPREGSGRRRPHHCGPSGTPVPTVLDGGGDSPARSFPGHKKTHQRPAGESPGAGAGMDLYKTKGGIMLACLTFKTGASHLGFSSQVAPHCGAVSRHLCEDARGLRCFSPAHVRGKTFPIKVLLRFFIF